MLSLGSVFPGLIAALALATGPGNAPASSGQSAVAVQCGCAWNVRFCHVRAHAKHFGCTLATTVPIHRFFNDTDEDDDGDNDREDDPGWLVQESQSSAVIPLCWTPLSGLPGLGSQLGCDSTSVPPLSHTFCRLRC
jgi:hypothetical protein